MLQALGVDKLFQPLLSPIKIQSQSKMAFVLKRIALVLVLICVFAQLTRQQAPTKTCPLLCTTSCAAGTSCTTCYSDFVMASPSNNQNCTCPPATYLDSTFFCKPCPIYCQSCSNYTMCTSCHTGYILKNNYSCILNTTNSNGWVSKNVTFQMIDYTGISNLVLIVNGTSINITNTPQSIGTLLSNCSKLSSYNWLGGYQFFNFQTKLIKTVFNLPPHQWINIMFQAILIDKWQNNTLLLEINTQQNYNPNSLQNSSVIWSGLYDSRLRFYDFCGDASVNDSLAIANTWLAHNASSVKLQIRLRQSNESTTTYPNLNSLSFGVRQFFIRVGTCGRNCKYCSSPSMCTQCFAPYSASNGTCVCDSSLSVGFPTLTGCSLLCVAGSFYNQTAKDCITCSDKYKNCNTCNQAQCLTCNPGFLYSTDTSRNIQCVRFCSSNFTEYRGYTVVTNQSINNTVQSTTIIRDQCVACPSNCLTCNKNICLFCYSTYQYYQGECVINCPVGTYSSYGSCLNCSLNCTSCNSSGCTNCTDGYALQGNQCYRQCANSTTVLNSSTSTCNSVCNAACLTCFGSSSNQCLSCPSGKLSILFGSCLIACPSNFYVKGSGCVICPFECSSCTDQNTCTNCTAGYYLSANQCVRFCPQATYPNISSINNTANLNLTSNLCLPCPSGCQRCSDSNTCLQCAYNYSFFNFTCLEDELDYFQPWEGDYRKCSANCLKCTNKICTRCSSNYFLNQGNCLSECPPEKYPKSTLKYDFNQKPYYDSVCAWKNPLCQQYNNTLQGGSCSQCSFTFPASVLLQSQSNIVCTLTCPQFYTKADNLTCVKCPQKCLRCFSNLTCTQCMDGYSVNTPNLLTSSNIMNQTCLLNVCPPKYFSDSLQCQSCPPGCLICLLDYTCYICDEVSGYYQDPNTRLCQKANCTLSNQYYESSNNSCISCAASCKTCFNSSTFCTSCPISIYMSLQTFLFNGSCIASCPGGYFAHRFSFTCRLCNPRCSSCTNFDNCLTCKPNLFILSFYSPQNSLCVAECPIGFWTNTTICQRCSPDCKTCYGPSEYQCLSCYPNFYLDDYKCVYICSPMKYKDNQGHCDWCHPSCQQCTGPSKQDCVGCPADQYYYDHRCFSVSCPGSTYLSIPELRICEPCQFGCDFCSSSQFCYFCTPGYKFYQGWCYKECPYNLASSNTTYYLQFLGEICNKNCKSAYSRKCLFCDNSCKRCIDGYYVYRTSTKSIYQSDSWVIEQCYNSCPVGTYPRKDGGRECVSCSSNCLSCDSYSKCNVCLQGYRLINGYCSTGCPASTYKVQLTCTNCPQQCISCTSFTTCTACAYNSYLYNSLTYLTITCVYTCPNTYYADISGWCVRCPSTCVTCNNATSCSSCQTGYLLTSGACSNTNTNTTVCTASCLSCSAGNCKACSGSLLLLTNPNTGSTTCQQSCPSNWFAFAGKCNLCNSTCATCSNNQNNCTSCVAGLYFYQQKCLPTCPISFYADSSTLTCKSCPANCMTCNNGSCTQCSSGFFLYDGICSSTCPATTFVSPSTQICFNCNDNCAACVDMENCTACVTGYSLYNLACLKVCPSTTYPITSSTGQVCVSCVSPCFTCTSPTTCLSCISTYVLNGTICQQTCGNGYFLKSYYVDYEDQGEGQDFSNFLKCLRCNVECLTCKNYASGCITCAVGYVLANGLCKASCPDGTYNASTICQPCSSYCVTCSNLNTCAVCVQGTVLYNGFCLSNCPQGNYMVLNSTATVSYYYCTGCSRSCQSCNGSTQYNCLSCNAGLFLYNAMCLPTCPQGTYATNLTRTCSPCPITCTNCTSFSNCTGCVTNYTLSNTNQCNPPTYIVCNVNYCVSCSPNNSSQCLQCINNYYLLSNGSCSITCPSSTYAQTGQCINCPSTCLTCTPTQCTSCQTSYYLYLGSCYASCPVSTLPKQNICIPDPCLYYNNSYPNGCLACSAPYLLATINSTTGYQSCVSSCPTATVQSGSQCIACPSNCNICISSTTCTTCTINTYLADGQCVKTCPVGTYNSVYECKSCNISLCVQCSAPSNCTKCSSASNAFLFNGQCYLNCPIGTYNNYNSGLCINCSISCQTCTSASYCTSCISNYYFYQGSCILTCPSGTYQSSSATISRLCTNCSTGCNKCTSVSNCTACQTGFVYLSSQNSCLTSCPSGFYTGLVSSSTFSSSSQYQCIACVAPCLTCTSSSSCVTCQSGSFYLNPGLCVSSCPIGYYSSSTISSSGTSQASCLLCDSSCLACNKTATYCIACPSGYILDSQGNCNSNCTSPSTYYVALTRQCLNCAGSCYSCTGPLSTDCLSCKPPLALLSGSCLNACPFGYYASSTYVCTQCSSSCASCSVSATNCTSCTLPNLLQTTSAGFICSTTCSASYFPNNVTQSCQPCNSTCLNCTGPASDQCSSCPSGKILSGGSCISSCPSGTTLVQQGTQSVCKSCGTGCASCQVNTLSTQATTCTQCQTSYYIYSGSCLTSCPAGTYSSPTSYNCTPCGLSGCQTCVFNSSMLVQCTVCQAGYYSLGNTGTCVTSCPSGYSLSNTQCVVIPTCQQYLYNGACIATCPTSTYPVTSPNKTCQNCSNGCYSCLSATSCLQCSNTTFLYLNTTSNTSTCITYCPTGYYGDATTGGCVKCSINCTACYQSNNQVTCTSCSPGVLLGTQCTQSCPTGYYSSSSNVCQLCSSICSSCAVSATNCTQCKNINYTAPACANPNCNATQYLNAAGTCTNCNSACATCYGGNSYECTTCSATTYNLNGQCLTTCPQGTTPDSSRTCVSCPSNCAVCSSNSTSQCSQCVGGYYLVLDTSQCVSNCNSLNTNTQTYYLNATVCAPCNLTNCLVCSYTTGPLQCQTCQSTASSYNNTCVSSCPQGTYATTNPNTCNKCLNNCSNCSSASNCTSCSAGYALVSGSCTSTCSSGFYLSTTNSITTCSPCIANCVNCSSATTCSSCVQPYALISNSCTGCLSGYYYSSASNTCLICSSSCSNCILTSTNCTSCASGYSLLQNTICVSTCPSGLYSSNSVCTPCSTSNCAVCPANACSSCSANYVQLYSSGVLTCISNCPTANFLSTTTNTCISCSVQCLTCTSATSCSQCSSTYFLYFGYCVSNCPTGYVSVVSNNNTCVACPTNCKICNSLTNCTYCVSGAYTIVNGICTTTINCSSGYYPNSLGNCSQCYPNCFTCNGALASNCLSCFDGSTLTNGACIQNCNTGTYYNSATAVCQPCSASYNNCASCNSTSCTICSGNYSLVGASCTLTCPNGTYLSNQQCYSCSSFCSVCSSSNNCTQCVSSTFLVNGTCSPSCPVTTYQNGGNCSACFQTCLTCTNSSSSSCTSCITPYNYYQNSCLVTCPNGTYSFNNTCQGCSTNCILCGSNGCTQCSSSYYLINGTCRSSCPTGYYVDTASSRCLQCVPPCTQCSSRNSCSACSSPYNIVGTNCIGPCPSGQYYNSSLTSCTSCSMSNCGICNATSCSACFSTAYSYYSNGVISACISNCSNIQGVYNDNAAMNCTSCFSNCQTCSNSTYCNLCSSGYYLLGISGLNVNECVAVCPLGYIATLLRSCLPCSSNCNVCLNSTYCEVCASNYYLFTTQTSNITDMSCVSQCPTGYSNPTIIDGNGSCILCPSNCLACVDNNTCTQCTSSLHALFSGSCIPYNCLNCQSCDTANNVCRNCTSPYYVNNGGCVAFCPNGYYGDNSTGRCTKCMVNCDLCFSATNCTQCSTGYLFVQSSSSCQNQGYVEFGAIGNMSGFTSNITQVMATVYVSTSAGPIAFGALANTYGIMNVCQFMYFLQGSCGDNPELSNFLNSLSMVSYSRNPSSSNDSTTNTTQGSTAARLLTGIEYTTSFLQTNLPIFLMMIGFVSAYILVLVFQKYNDSCCVNYPAARKYISYICQFMQKRFKYIYVDCVMWISYLPFLYFSILQIQKLQFDTGLNAISTIIAFIIIIVYPLYPIFILRKIFDKSSNPEQNLKNYSAITLQLPLDMEEQAKRPMCEGLTCCPKQNPDVSMVQMSLSPWIDSVVRPVYNLDIPEYNQFKYFTIPHFRLAYGAIKYIRKLIFVIVAAVCPDPVNTIAILVTLNVVYMLYLIILRPKQKIYLILELILETLILFFLVFMLIYLKLGGATVTAMSVLAHGIGFLLANSSLAIAIILNIMAYYTIVCCIIDLIRHMKSKAEVDEIKQIKKFNNQVDPEQFNDEKGDLPIEGYYGDDPEGGPHIDLEKEFIKKIQAENKEFGLKDKPKKGDDQMTEENNDEDYPVDQFNLDQKEFNVRSSMIAKKKQQTGNDGDDIPNLKISQGQERRKRRQNKKDTKQIKQPKYQGNTEDQIMMGKSKVQSEDSNIDVNQGLLKERENDKYKRKIGNNELNVEKGIIKEGTDRFKRNPKRKITDSLKPEQQSTDLLFTSPNAKQGNNKFEEVEDINTHDRIKKEKQEKGIPQGEALSRRIKAKQQKNKELDEVAMKERERLEKQKQKKVQEEIQNAKMLERQRNKKAAQDPFGDFQEILQPKQKEIEELAIKQKEKKLKENSLTKQNLVSDFLLQDDGLDLIQRKPQPKKPQNKFYKGSDDEGDIGQVQTRERQANKFKRNARNTQKKQDPNIDAVGIDINTKKADKKQSVRQFAEDNTQDLIYKERQGKGSNKKPASIQQKQSYSLEQAKGIQREKRRAQKEAKPASIQQNQPYSLEQAKGIQREKRRAQKEVKPNIYDVANQQMVESITFNNQVKIRKPKPFNDPDFQEQNMQKQKRKRSDEMKRQKDNKLKVGTYLQQSYDDVVNKNKQQVFKQDVTKMSHLLDIEGDFEEQNYGSRPDSKMQRPKSRNKDLGLSASNKPDEDSEDDSHDTRKQRHLASQRLRKKGNMQLKQEAQVEEDNGSRDSRRISKIQGKKMRIKSGVLNIDDNSENEDIQEFRL